MDNFRQLIEEHSSEFTPEFTLAELQKKIDSDPRWAACDEKDREAVFNEKMAPLKKEVEDSM